LLALAGSLLLVPVAAALTFGMSTWGYHINWFVDVIFFLITGWTGKRLGRLSIRWWVKFRRHTAIIGPAARKFDARPPVLYLRSFGIDKSTSYPLNGRMARYRTEEQQLARAFNAFGPLLALGRPGEQLPMLGAQRFYFSSTDWQQEVLGFIKESRLVLIAAGKSAALMWEIEQAVASVPPENIVIIVPFGQDSYEEFRSLAMPLLGHMLPVWIHEYRKSSSMIRAAVYFEPDWTAHFVRLDTVRGRGLEKSCYDNLASFYSSQGVQAQYLRRKANSLHKSGA
jgi:hypothetical protein